MSRAQAHLVARFPATAQKKQSQYVFRASKRSVVQPDYIQSAQSIIGIRKILTTPLQE